MKSKEPGHQLLKRRRRRGKRRKKRRERRRRRKWRRKKRKRKKRRRRKKREGSQNVVWTKREPEGEKAGTFLGYFLWSLEKLLRDRGPEFPFSHCGFSWSPQGLSRKDAHCRQASRTDLPAQHSTRPLS